MRLSLPRVRIRIQHPDEPDAYPYWEFDTEDAAAIHAGVKFPYIAEIITAAGDIANDVSNLIAGPGFEGMYLAPDQIRDEALAYYATDQWAWESGGAYGGLFRHGGRIWRVLYGEFTDQDYGAHGYATGFLICQATTGGDTVRVWLGDTASRDVELTAGHFTPRTN